MIVKVCGITSEVQLDNIIRCNVDMVGFNFYPNSKRFISKPILSPLSNVKRVGVFVNPSIEQLETIIFNHKLDLIQLHGNESPEFCSKASKLRPVIKAFGVDQDFSFDQVELYDYCTDYMLFDNRTTAYGGSGQKFDWSILAEYNGNTPFLLSGGISLNDINEINGINHEMLTGIDVNSGFETSPGIKNIESIREMMKILRNEKSR